MKKLCVIHNVDTRIGHLDLETRIFDRGDGMLPGCRSLDFLTEGIRNKVRFFDNANSNYEVEHIVVIDEVQPVPDFLPLFINNTPTKKNHSIKVVVRKFDKSKTRWNDHLYIESLRLAPDCDYIAHFDQDTAAFAAKNFDPLEFFVWGGLDFMGVTYVSVPYKHQHPESYDLMKLASTRFFLCERESLNLDEAEKCVQDIQYAHKYYRHLNRNAGRRLPCLEHVLGYMAGENSVCYPTWNPALFMIFCW